MSDDPHTASARESIRLDRLRAGLLGLNAWAILVAIPMVYVDAGLLPIALSPLPLAALVAGLGLLGERQGLARALLLGVYPPALGVAIAACPALIERDAYGPIAMALGAGATIAYAAAAAIASSRERRVVPHEQLPATTKDPVVEPAARRWGRRFLLVSAAVGGMAIAVVAASWGRHTELVRAWGDSADDAAVLTSIVASLVTAIALGALVGPALRAERTAEPSSKRQRRLSLALFVAGAAAVAWLLLMYFDRRGV